jgi:hypothetical protein
VDKVIPIFLKVIPKTNAYSPKIHKFPPNTHDTSATTPAAPASHVISARLAHPRTRVFFCSVLRRKKRYLATKETCIERATVRKNDDNRLSMSAARQILLSDVNWSGCAPLNFN